VYSRSRVHVVAQLGRNGKTENGAKWDHAAASRARNSRRESSSRLMTLFFFTTGHLLAEWLPIGRITLCAGHNGTRYATSSRAWMLGVVLRDCSLTDPVDLRLHPTASSGGLVQFLGRFLLLRCTFDCAVPARAAARSRGFGSRAQHLRQAAGFGCGLATVAAIASAWLGWLWLEWGVTKAHSSRGTCGRRFARGGEPHLLGSLSLKRRAYAVALLATLGLLILDQRSGWQIDSR